MKNIIKKHTLTKVIYVLSFLILVAFFGCNTSDNLDLRSPDGSIEFKVDNQNNQLTYEIYHRGKPVIISSNLGLESSQRSFSKGSIVNAEQTEVNKTWSPIYGEKSEMINHYRESVMTIKTAEDYTMMLRTRVYDDGVAFRYEIPQQEDLQKITLTEDLTTFRFEKDFECRKIRYRDMDSEFKPEPLSTVEYSKPPMVVQTENSWVALNEANIYDMSMMYFVNPDHETAMHASIGLSELELPAKTPWRVIQIGNEAADFIHSDILPNLNEPCNKEEFSWVKPGKSLWEWRNRGDTINGFVYSCNEASFKRLIDDVAELNLDYVLFCDGWYSKKGPQYPRKDLDMPSLIEYAKSKKVEILLYVDRQQVDANNDWDLEEVLQTFKKWGAAGIKYGFLSFQYELMDPSTFQRQEFVNETWDIVKTSAEYQMLVNFHDFPLHPGGERITWPNKITSEFGHGQQDARKSFGPRTAVSAPFFIGISGPIDMTNGFYDLEGLHRRIKVDKEGIFSTVAAENARCLINYTPLLILGDNGDEFQQKKDLFDFIQSMPDTWDESKVLHGKPEDYIIIARRSGEDWFVGGNTDEEERSFEVSLDFLGKGNYDITLYLDAEDTHYINNKETYEIKSLTGNENSVIPVRMAPGGGFSMKIIKQD